MKKHRLIKLLCLALACSLAFTPLSGCGEKESESGKLKVALILPGVINDQGWNAMAYNGLKEIETKFGAETNYMESVSKQDMESAFRNYASNGYDVVFGHGFEYTDAAKAVAAEFPDTKFIVTSSDLAEAPNMGSVTNSNIEIGFLLGVVAGVTSRSGIMGSLNGLESPQISESIQGMDAGLRYIRPEMQHVVSYTGSFDDAGKAREMAVAMAEQGVDVIQGDPNQMSLGILEACEQTGMKFLGVMGDFAASSPDVVITSGLVDFGKAMSSVVELIQAGVWEPRQYDFGVKEDVVYLAPYGKFDSILTQEQKDTVQDVIDKIKSGEIDVRALAEENQ